MFVKQWADLLLSSRLFWTTILSLAITIVALVALWDKPELLRVVFLIAIIIAASATAVATYMERKQWIFFGAVVSALCGFAASYFGDLASGKKINSLKEDMKMFIAATELKDRSLELGNDEMRRRLETMYQRLFDSLPDESEQWARKFVEMQPIREEEIHTRDNELRDEYQRQAPHIPIVFRLMLSMFDSRMHALETQMKGVEVEEIAALPSEILIQPATKDRFGEMKIRIVRLPNGRSIEASITQGEWTEGIITRYPSFYLTEIPSSKKPRSRQLEFGIRYVTLGPGPIPYPLQSDQVVMDKFLELFGKSLDQMLGEILARDPIQ
jgi:hypothetical protein